ncbi:MAG TPA: tRNA pseudouridine(38-40) synthase TruA [bacterium]|nr:tRNA pseudouridine(38-40) synthase TruA [bacterium]
MNHRRVIRLTVEYDGSDFSGWQIQPKRRTVQGEMEKALKQLTGRGISITGSGRTDAGVHALAQVVSFPEENGLPLIAYHKGLNRLLPEDIMVHEAEEVAGDFNARKMAVRRTYRYVFMKNPGVITRRFAWYSGPLNILPMEKAGKALLGEHDFTSFCKPDKKETHVAEIMEMSWKSLENQVYFTIAGSRFFHHMVRIILGTLLEVGRGSREVEEIAEILAAKDRRRAGRTIPPQGLYLCRIDYENG